MKRRKSLGDNPLDLVIPPAAESAPAEEPSSKAVGSEEPADEPPAGEAAAAEPAATDDRERQDVSGLAGQYLTFYLGDEEYGSPILQVKEIVEFTSLTTVPTTPPWIRGVMNLRGSVIPVVDLGRKFGRPETAVTRRTCVVIVEVDIEGEQSGVGVMVDGVSQVIDLPQDRIEPPPAFGTSVQVDYLLGMGKTDGGFILLLNIERILTTDELVLASSLDLPEAAGEEDGGDAEVEAPSQE